MCWSRAVEYQGVPGYFLVEHGWRSLAGSSEASLRIPSMVAMGIALWGTIRLGDLLVDRGTGLLAAVLLATNKWIVFAANDARPYAQAIACLTWAIVWLIRAERSGSAWAWASAMLLSSATLWTQALFGLSLAVAWTLVGARSTNRTRIQWTIASASVGVLAAPLLPILSGLASRRATLTFRDPPTLGDAWEFLDGRHLIVLAALTLFLSLFGRGSREWTSAVPGKLGWSVVLGWSLFAPLTLFLCDPLLGLSMWLPRYLSQSLPAIVLLLAALVRRSLADRAAVILGGVAILLSLIDYGRTQHQAEDWRGALAFVQSLSAPTSPTKILFRSGLVEARAPTAFESEDRRAYLNAPAVYYHLAAETLPLPYADERSLYESWRRWIAQRLKPGDRVVLVVNVNAPFDVQLLLGDLVSLNFDDERRLGPIRVMSGTWRSEPTQGD